MVHLHTMVTAILATKNQLINTIDGVDNLSTALKILSCILSEDGAFLVDQISVDCAARGSGSGPPVPP